MTIPPSPPSTGRRRLVQGAAGVAGLMLGILIGRSEVDTYARTRADPSQHEAPYLDWLVANMGEDGAYAVVYVVSVAVMLAVAAPLVFMLLSRIFAGYLFVSYAREDQRYARRVRRRLFLAGVPTWMDTKLEYGDKWAEVLHEKIDGAAGLIVISSRAACESDWVEKEVEYARSQSKSIVQILLDESTSGSFGCRTREHRARRLAIAGLAWQRPPGQGFVRDTVRLSWCP